MRDIGKEILPTPTCEKQLLVYVARDVGAEGWVCRTQGRHACGPAKNTVNVLIERINRPAYIDLFNESQRLEGYNLDDLVLTKAWVEEGLFATALEMFTRCEEDLAISTHVRRSCAVPRKCVIDGRSILRDTDFLFTLSGGQQ